MGHFAGMKHDQMFNKHVDMKISLTHNGVPNIRKLGSIWRYNHNLQPINLGIKLIFSDLVF